MAYQETSRTKHHKLFLWAACLDIFRSLRNWVSDLSKLVIRSIVWIKIHAARRGPIPKAKAFLFPIESILNPSRILETT